MHWCEGFIHGNEKTEHAKMKTMEFKKGCGWTACYEKERNLYTLERSGCGSYDLYEITAEMYEALEEGMSDHDSYQITKKARHLYMDVNDRCGPPYTVVLDHDYEKLCPWARAVSSGEVLPDELTDAAVELFESEENNREQRRKSRDERENND